MARRLALIATAVAVGALLVACGSDDDSSGDTASETTAAPDGAASSDDGDAEFCAAYDTFQRSFEDLPNDTVEGLRAGVDALVEGSTALREVVPDELTEDADLMVQGANELAEAIADAETVEEAQAAAAEVFEDERYDTENDVDLYFNESCPQANDEQAPAEGDGEG
jgi:hypothetical protein